jgi:hypothetical protein
VHPASLRDAWRAPVAAAGTAGAVLGMLPGAFLMVALRDPLPTLAVGPILFLNAAIFAGVASVVVTNLDGRRRDRSLIGRIMTVSLATAGMVAALWVALVWSGTWTLVFPFRPYAGLLGLALVIGSAASLAAQVYREPFEPDVHDLVFLALWAAIPPALVLSLLKFACANDLCS